MSHDLVDVSNVLFPFCCPSAPPPHTPSVLSGRLENETALPSLIPLLSLPLQPPPSPEIKMPESAMVSRGAEEAKNPK